MVNVCKNDLFKQAIIQNLGPYSICSFQICNLHPLKYNIQYSVLEKKIAFRYDQNTYNYFDSHIIWNIQIFTLNFNKCYVSKSLHTLIFLALPSLLKKIS